MAVNRTILDFEMKKGEGEGEGKKEMIRGRSLIEVGLGVRGGERGERRGMEGKGVEGRRGRKTKIWRDQGKK